MPVTRVSGLEEELSERCRFYDLCSTHQIGIYEKCQDLLKDSPGYCSTNLLSKADEEY